MAPLRPRAVLPIAGAFTLLAALGIFYFPGRSYDSHLAALRAKAVALAELTAHGAAPALDFDDLELIDEHLRGTARDGDLGYVAVYREGGRLVRSLDRAGVGLPATALPARATTTTELREGWVHVVTPVRQRSGANGSLVAGFSTRRAELAHASAERGALGIGLAIFLLGVAVALWNGVVMRNLERLAEESSHARRRAEEASRAKSDFLAKMSHELRTPMNGILGMVDVLLRTELTGAQRRSAELVMRSGEQLLSIVNDVLDFAKVEAGKLELHERSFDVRELAERVTDHARVLVRGKPVEVACHVATEVPPYLHGDPQRIEQVLLNFVSNAIKFTDRGRVALRITCQSGGEPSARVRVRFEVGDTGLGIPEDALDSLFDAFMQVDGSRTRRHGGTGLGLTICKQLVVDLMGGSIAVQSELGAGSTFHFEVELARAQEAPVVSAKPATPAAAALTADRPQLRALRVLAAEDNAGNREVLSSMLAYLGCEVTLVEDGQAALHALADGHRFDVVLMDCQMPVMDGTTATRTLRAREAAAGRSPLPIVAITAHALAEERDAALAAGMQAFATKPITIASLSNVLAAVCPEGAGLRVSLPPGVSVAAPSAVATSDPSAEPTPILDRSIFDDLLRLQSPRNPRLVASLVERFENDGAIQLAALRTAAFAAATTDLDRLAHALKGWSATLGAVEVAALCREIEALCDTGSTDGAEPLIARLESAHARALEALRNASSAASPASASH